MKKKCALISFIAVLMISALTGTGFAFDKLFLVTNQTALDLAKDFITTLNNESIPLTIVMDQFEKVKKEKYIVVLGGAKGPGSVDEFIQKVLSKEEQQAGNQPGGKIFVKENVFAEGQVIIVFAGPTEAAAGEARKNSRKTWWGLFSKWFDLDVSLPMAY